MKYVVFDVETQNAFSDVGKNEPALLDISVMCLYDSSSDSYHAAAVDELEKLWPFFEKADAIVGYNSNHFDIPILNKYYPGSLTEIQSIDILEAIKNSYGRRVRLSSVAEATLGAEKGGDGLRAIEWWKKGEIEKIKTYCKKDVELTKDLFLYAQKNRKLKLRDGLTVREITIDTTNWKNRKQNAMTHTLPF